MAAYKTAAAKAIATNQIITQTLTRTIKFSFDYPIINEVMRLVKDNTLHIQQLDRQTKCEITLYVREALAEKLCSQLDQILS